MTEGDYAVVMSPEGWPTCVQVLATEGLSQDEHNEATKVIVCKVDVARYTEKQAHWAFTKELQRELDQEIQATHRYQLYIAAAQHNPRVCELLQRLAGLDPTVKALLNEAPINLKEVSDGSSKSKAD